VDVKFSQLSGAGALLATDAIPLVRTPGAAALQSTIGAIGFITGNQAPVAGSAMQIDKLVENQPAAFPLQNEASIWAQTTYSYAGFSQTMTSATVPGAGGSPLATLFAFANNNGSAGDVVAFVGDAVARQNTGVTFGGNLIARNGAGVIGAKLVGLEIDIEPAAGTTISTSSCGLIFNIFNITGADPTPVCTVGGVGGGIWGNGFLTSHIAGAHFAVQSGDPVQAKSFINTTNAASGFSQAAIMLGQGAAQGINFGGNAFGTSPYLYGDSSGNLNINTGAGDLIAWRNPSGTLTGTINALNGILNLQGTTPALQVASTQVVGAQITGYGTPTNGGRISNFPGSGATLAQCGQEISQLIIDLKTHGLLGT
jgi:hypothetical protein